jgi:hypothetical protein
MTIERREKFHTPAGKRNPAVQSIVVPSYPGSLFRTKIRKQWVDENYYMVLLFFA